MEKEAAAQAESQTTQSRLLLVLFLLLFVVVLLRNAWLSDDAFITLRTVRNFNEGYGLVWNTHERVQAYTHPLWMLLLSGTYFVTRESFYSTIALSILFSTATAALIVFKIARNVVSGIFALLLLLLSKAFVDYTSSGLENPLTYFLLALFFYIYSADLLNVDRSDDAHSRAPHFATHRLFWLTLIAALGVTNRMDTALIFLPAMLYAFYTQFSWRAVWAILGGGAPFFLWTFFSIIYYGFPFPNTAYAKLVADIPASERYSQGYHYLLDSLSVDPITLLMIGLATVYVLIARQFKVGLIVLGAVLYVGYVVNIGGDFMSGRFFSVPYLGAVLVFSQQRMFAFADPRSYLLFLGVAVVGLLNPAQSPILSNGEYSWPAVGGTGIADERGHYYGRFGLMSSDRENRLKEQSIVRGTETPEDFVHCGIGFRGFTASPQTRLIDYCGLADAFVARLPATYEPSWRAGHIWRRVPLDYIGTLRTGESQFRDPNLATFYDKLTQVTQGDLWSRQRLVEIWRFNTGAYRYLLDDEMLRFPDLIDLAVEENSADEDRWMMESQLFFGEDFELEITAQGVRLTLDKLTHATHVDIGIDSNYFEVVYFLDGAETGRQTVTNTPLSLGGRLYSVATVPAAVAQQGYDAIRVSPRVADEYIFTYMGLSNLSASTMEANHVYTSALDLRAALQLTYHLFYRDGETRDGRAESARLLPQLLSRLEQTEADLWTELPQTILLDLLMMPDPAIHAVVMPHLQQDILLVDSGGNPKMRFVGHGDPETPERGPGMENDSVVQLNLYFLVEEAFDEAYSLWFGIKQRHGRAGSNEAGGDEAGSNEAGSDQTSSVESSAAESAGEVTEWMVYDHFPKPPITQWGQGTLLHLEPEIRLAPGTYEFTFGFWTPNDRRRLTTEDPNVYWIDIGEQVFKPTSD